MKIGMNRSLDRSTLAMIIERESGVQEMLQAIAGLIKASDALEKELRAEAGIVKMSRSERDFAMGVLKKYV